MTKINRRRFMIIGAASAGGIVAASWTLGQPRNINNQRVTAIAQQTNQAIQPVHRSKNGLLEVKLTASFSSVQLADQAAYLLNYNGQVPAPRLEAKPGDMVRIHFTNKLNQPTNLHYHGLHVSPIGSADNVFLDILPGQSYTYEFKIPANHPAGTFWYHPHRHGYVAEQVFGGLAGLFIVHGDLDLIPAIATAKEEFLILQDFDLDRKGHILAPLPMQQMLGREGQLITANGQDVPEFEIPTDRFLRLRLLNASPSRFYRLAFADSHPFYLIATDGGGIPEPIGLTELLLVPGERAEILIQGDRQPQQYSLVNLPYDRGGMGRGPGMMMRNRGMIGGFNRDDFDFGDLGDQIEPIDQSRAIAKFTCNGSVPKLPLPKKLVAVEELPEPTQIRRLVLNHGMMPGYGMVFLINGWPFVPDQIDTQVRLDTIEDWEIVNQGVMDHPFHLHVNHFQVVSRNGEMLSNPIDRAWKDTVLVRTGESVRIRIPFRDFAGKTVYHCHILDHEDLGMMGILEIQA
jgi:FtsP/CotA-like multicopper oxidase with cupredoxin domain